MSIAKAQVAKLLKKKHGTLYRMEEHPGAPTAAERAAAREKQKELASRAEALTELANQEISMAKEVAALAKAFLGHQDDRTYVIALSNACARHEKAMLAAIERRALKAEAAKLRLNGCRCTAGCLSNIAGLSMLIVDVQADSWEEALETLKKKGWK